MIVIHPRKSCRSWHVFDDVNIAATRDVRVQTGGNVAIQSVAPLRRVTIDPIPNGRIGQTDVAAPGQLQGDTDLDGEVTFGDFLRLAEGFGKAGRWRDGDFDGNGEVSFSDFLQLAEMFGKSVDEVFGQQDPFGL